MKAIFLRGAIPPAKENPEKLLYDDIGQCEDMWTQLFHALLLETGMEGELLYQGGDKEVVSGPMTERWVPSFANYVPAFEPDLVMCRGGFPYYDPLVKRFPKAYRAYYGAGKRFYPHTDFTDYHLFLVDSERQRVAVKAKGGNAQMLLKPAASLFKPVKANKEFEVCFMANAAQQKIKRHRLLINAVANTGLKVLNIGNKDPALQEYARRVNADITWAGWHLRKHLPELISRCKVGVCCSTNRDSCPRVIPEYLACGLPVVATANINFWNDKYISNRPRTGLLVGEDGIADGIHEVLSDLGAYRPRKHYVETLSLDVAARRLKEQIINGFS